MKRRAKRRQPSSKPSRQRPAASVDRRIILVNDAPLRQRAAAECKRELAKLDKARAEWQRYEQIDEPAFARWTAATFGPLLTELRENALLLDQQDAFIEEVELEMICGNHRNHRKAYAAVKREWDNPDPADDLDDLSGRGQENGGSDPSENVEDGVPEEMHRALFEEFVRCMGADPKRMSKAQSEEMFAQYEAAIAEEEEERTEPTRSQVEKKPAAISAEARLKEIYRTLVRRLHPDLRAAAGATVSVIWHEVQEAYQAKNLDRLETLLALTQMQEEAGAGQASLSQMRVALEELRRSLRSLQRSISDAKREPAWGFSLTPYHAPLEKRLRRELEATLSRQRRELAQQRRILDQWSRPKDAPVERAGKDRGTGAKDRTAQARRTSNAPVSIQAELFAS